MTVKDSNDPLSQLLPGLRISIREEIWIWLGLYLYERFDLERHTCNGETMRDVVAQALMGAPKIRADIPNKKDRYLLPAKQLEWIIDTPRQIQWLTAKIDNLTERVLPMSLPHLQGRDRLVAALDIWRIDLEEKQREVATLHDLWRRHIAKDNEFEWFTDTKEGTKRCECAWDWLQKKHLKLFSRRPPISNYQELLMFFDQEDIGRNERTAMIREIKRRWSRKQFDERAADKKQVNVMLSKTVIAQLDTLAETHGLKRAQVIESLVRMEADAGVYLADA
ncbi:hypothetical protein [Stutzerimonas azotifigens]|uniref:Uncharacterized protein n=1 Tax=Stutzerimonas azotifigens TaxID=291995 RepID=A0ABR5Z5B9_9GAMM|nr:hypothetical protein [Stutzerimonas azotifigens]MBA1275326.1 hypothetical protein [Stutzerimonas azotifigens]